MDENDIVHMTIDYENILTLDDIKDLHAAAEKISGGLMVVVFIKRKNSNEYKGISREARIYAAGKEATKIFKAVAVLIANPVIRMAANFFIRVSKPPYPIRMFTSESEAISWLKKVQK